MAGLSWRLIGTAMFQLMGRVAPLQTQRNLSFFFFLPRGQTTRRPHCKWLKRTTGAGRGSFPEGGPWITDGFRIDSFAKDGVVRYRRRRGAGVPSLAGGRDEFGGWLNASGLLVNNSPSPTRENQHYIRLVPVARTAG